MTSHEFVRALKRFFGAFLLACACVALPAIAAADVSSHLVVQKVVTDTTGHEVLKSAADAKPGDVLQYRATYTNKGTSAAEHMLARLPIPVGTTLQTDSSLPPGAFGSVNGVSFEPMPLMREIAGKDGKSHREPVPLADIRVLRWDLGNLEPRQSKSIQLSVRVDAPPPPSAHR